VEAIWVKSGKLGWTLKDERGGVLASLSHLPAESTRMRCEISGRSWTFKRRGFSRPLGPTRAEGTDRENVALLTSPTGAKPVRFGEDRMSSWTSRPSIPQLTWNTPGGAMTIRPHLIAARGLVWFQARRPDVEQLRLAALGWYFILMDAGDAASLAAPAVATSAAG
jgi:hypothetical protein